MSSPLIISPVVGDNVVLGNLFANITITGIISDLDTPAQVSASLELNGSNGLLSIPVLQGRPGAQGDHAFILKLQYQVFDDPDDLPTNLTDDEDIDVGKYWIVREFDDAGNAISSKAYVWFGDHYEWFPMGTQGPVGPVPIITFNIELLDPDDADLENEVVVTGDDYHPSVLLKIKAPRGPQGVMGDMEEITNFDASSPSSTGDVPTFNEATNKWEPRPSGNIVPLFYTMPEAAFTDVPFAFGTRVPIGSFTIPVQEWDVLPKVFGHVRIIGVELDADPFIVGVEVRLGEGGATGGGTLVARGYGNISTYTHIIPHYSGSAVGTTADAVTPDNGRGVVPAGAVGPAATLYINAFNDGLAGKYNFSKRGAQLSIDLNPV